MSYDRKYIVFLGWFEYWELGLRIWMMFILFIFLLVGYVYLYVCSKNI